MAARVFNSLWKPPAAVPRRAGRSPHSGSHSLGCPEAGTPFGPGDRQEKPAAYAAAGIPVHLLIDRDVCELVVHTNPDPNTGRYRDRHTAPFGEQVTLPDPVGITLETEILKNYVRRSAAHRPRAEGRS